MARPTPMLTDQDKALVKRLHKKGRSIIGLAKEFECSTITIRRALFPEKYNIPRKPEAKKRKLNEHAIDARERRQPVFRVSDVPNHPMERLIHEGPTQEQRALMQGMGV
jgi:chromatin remodeling complex protein RSC6